MKVLQGVFHAVVHLGQRKATWRSLDETGRPNVERSVRRLAYHTGKNCYMQSVFPQELICDHSDSRSGGAELFSCHSYSRSRGTELITNSGYSRGRGTERPQVTITYDGKQEHKQSTTRSQNMTHFTTQTHHTNPNHPISVVSLIVHEKLLIACGQRVFHVSDLSAFGASPSDQWDVALGLSFLCVYMVIIWKHVRAFVLNWLSEVNLLALLKTNSCEIICQGCYHWSRTKVMVTENMKVPSSCWPQTMLTGRWASSVWWLVEHLVRARSSGVLWRSMVARLKFEAIDGEGTTRSGACGSIWLNRRRSPRPGTVCDDMLKVLHWFYGLVVRGPLPVGGVKLFGFSR